MNMFRNLDGPRGRGFLVGFAAVFLPLSLFLLIADRELGIKAILFLILLALSALGGGMTALMCWTQGPRGAKHGAGLGAAAWLIVFLGGIAVFQGGIVYLAFALPFLAGTGILAAALGGRLLKSPFPTSAEVAVRK